MSIQPGIDRSVDDYGGRVADRLNRLASIDILNGTFIENVKPMSDGALTKVSHGLNRTPRGWMIVQNKYDGVEYYKSSAYDPSSTTSGSETHGHGAVPTEIRAYLKCTSADLNYSVGDIVYLDSNITSGVASDGVALWADATTTDWAVGTSGVTLLNTSTRAAGAATLGNWDLYIESWRRRTLHDGTNNQSSPDRSRFLYLYGAGFTGTDKVDLWVF